MKKVMLLGGSRYLRPIVKACHELGYRAITVDYLPDNYAHQISDEYHNVSIIDREAVLQLAKELEIDGILSFACDPGVVTAAYVAEKLGLPTSPYKSVALLQNKAAFRAFLSENGFNVPVARGYHRAEDAMKDAGAYQWPVIVKPTDSAGSKGVTRVEDPENLRKSIEYALSFSHSDGFIVEEFIEKKGDSSDSDCFSVNGELIFASFNNQKFDAKADNPYTPAAYTWPCEMKSEIQEELQSEIQRLLGLLNMGTTIYNVETRVGADGKPYIMEVSPRGGGNRLAEVLEFATGADLIKNTCRAAVGDEIEPIRSAAYDGFWAEIILHSEENGIYKGLEVKDVLRPFIFQEDLWVEKGDDVHTFAAANFAIGTLILRFDTAEEMHWYTDNIYEYLKIIVE